MELVCIEFWTAEDNKQRTANVLVITDHFTKFSLPQLENQTGSKTIVGQGVLPISQFPIGWYALLCDLTTPDR